MKPEAKQRLTRLYRKLDLLKQATQVMSSDDIEQLSTDQLLREILRELRLIYDLLDQISTTDPGNSSAHSK